MADWKAKLGRLYLDTTTIMRGRKNGLGDDGGITRSIRTLPEAPAVS